MMKRPSALALGLMFTTSLSAGASLASPAPSVAPPRQWSAAEIGRAIERLGVVGRVLYVAAHPDDENTKLLSWLASEKLVRAAYLSLTRGEGGQNLIGSEQGPLLGLIRTQELLAARRVDGAEQWFTRARDFGYSKTPEETLAIWDRDAVLADVARVIREFKPDVIITRFPQKGGDTHGHHTASAILALDAFRAAADASFQPDQVKQFGTWEARRIAWNKSSFFIKPGEDLSAFLKLDIGGFNPALGASYGEIAALSRSMHKSQGFGAAATRGPSLEYFQVTSGSAPATGKGIFEDLDWTWSRVKGGDKLAALLKHARAEYKSESPAASIPLLLEAWDELERLADNPWKAEKASEFADVIGACAGLYAEATAADFDTVAGGEVQLTATVLNRSGAPLTLKEIRLPGSTVPVGKPLPQHEPVQIEHKFKVSDDADVTSPYWLVEPPTAGSWTVPDPSLIGRPERPPALVADFIVQAGNRTFSVTRPIAYKWTDPVMGERYRSVEIVPRAALNPASPILMFPDARAKELRVLVKAGSEATGAVKIEAPPEWKVEPASIPFKLEKRGAEEEVVFHVTPPLAPTKQATLRAVAEIGGKSSSRGLLRIEHGHIPIQTLMPVAEVRAVRFDLKKKRTRIGYIPGAGDEVAASLRSVGYEVVTLADDALRDRKLDDLQAIVVGVRAWNTNPRLPSFHKRLMDYVSKGGTLVAQYNTANRISKLPPEMGPYPFEVTQDRVTDEKAAVTFDDAANPLLHSPNAITTADFSDWIQERGLYFAGKWDAKYQTVLSMSDPGEPARKGSLIVAKHGKGAFIYTGLAFFRQLPAGVPGAFRLFTNLIDHGSK